MKTQPSSSPHSSNKSGPNLNADCSLDQVAHLAIHKSYKKSTKFQKGVLEDQDPENLHQMRIGMRRLRTAIDVFAPAIDLPSPAQRARITKIAKQLGRVRDLDVLQLWFQHYLSIADMDNAESEMIQLVLTRLHKRRRKKFAKLPALFKSKDYRQFIAAYDQWLKNPRFHPVATMPILDVIPDLLLPLLSQLFLHPGWLVATETLEGRLYPILEIGIDDLDGVLATDGLALHDLRKQIKRVRYQTEFFIPFYGKPYQLQTRGFRDLQALLGLFQDEAVLSKFMIRELGPAWPEKQPSLANLLREERFRNWQRWQTLQRKYLDPKFRRTLSRRVMLPAM